MADAAIQLNPSWRVSESPIGLSDIFSEDVSVAVWQRQEIPEVNQYFNQVFSDLGMGIRQVYTLDSLKDGLNVDLPDARGKAEAIEDVHLLSDMLTCLFNCDAVGLRLVPLDKAMCPKLHTDNIPVRLVNTYLGPGTQWLPVESTTDKPRTNFEKTRSGLYYSTDAIEQMQTFDVGLLKGSAWEGQEHMAALHKSCPVTEHEKRVLLTLDPM